MVTQRHVGAVAGQLAFLALHQNHGHGVCGVSSPRATIWALHHFGIAVVCGDQQRASHAVGGLHQLSYTGVDSGDCFSGGFHFAGVPHHVRIGVIDYHQRVNALFDCGNTAFSELAGGHFRG